MSQPNPKLKVDVIFGPGPTAQEGALWFFYASARAKFITEHPELYELQAEPIMPGFEEELAGRRMLADSCQHDIKHGKQPPSTYLSELLRVQQADFLPEYVWHYLAQPHWSNQQRPKHLPEFLAWASQNLSQHKVETHGGIKITRNEASTETGAASAAAPAPFDVRNVQDLDLLTQAAAMRAAFKSRDFAELGRLAEEIVKLARELPKEPGACYACFRSNHDLNYFLAGHLRIRVIRLLDWCIAEAMFMKAFVLSQNQAFAEALAGLEGLIALAPTCAQAYGEKGYVLNRLKRPQEALAAYALAWDLASRLPQNRDQAAPALRGMGVTLAELGDLHHAEKLLQSSLVIDPNSQVAKGELDYIERLRRGARPATQVLATLQPALAALTSPSGDSASTPGAQVAAPAAAPPEPSPGVVTAATPPHSPLDAFSGTILPTEVSQLYKTGLALVALGMVFLPLFYATLVGLTAWGSAYCLVHGAWVVTVPGLILFAFMLKPLLAKRPPRPVTFTLQREQEPLLFAFIDRICALVHAPVPQRVDVNCEVNAYAGFPRGVLSVVGNELVLTIGLPLAAGLNMREFAGVLAHEFGHFAQGAGMRLSYVIRHVNLWFARVVHDPDRWDQRLQRAAGGKDFRIALILLFASGVIWLTRRILSLLMHAGHTISCFMLRQMEYDADSYQCKVAGSDTFGPTHFRIRTLQLAAQTALGDMRESWRSGHLPEDYPDFVTRKAAMFSLPVLQQIQHAAAQGKTKRFDTHPSDGDRVRAAREPNVPGVFGLTEPAARLFMDFPRLCRELTRFFYEKQQHLVLREQNLVNNEESSNESAANLQRQHALQVYLHGINTVFLPVVLRPEQLFPLLDWKESARRLKDARERLGAAVALAQQALKQHINADTAWSKAACAHYLLSCGFTIPPQQFGLSSASLPAAKQNLNAYNAEMDRSGIVLKSFAETAGQRLAAACQLLSEPSVAARIGGAAALRQEAMQLSTTLAALGPLLEPAHKIRRRLPALDLLLGNRQNHKEPAKVDAQVRALAGDLKSALEEIRTKGQEVPYPFPHAWGQISLAEYATADAKGAKELQTIHNESRAALDRLLSLYYRILGRLVLMALTVEVQLPHLEPRTEVPAAEAPGKAAAVG